MIKKLITISIAMCLFAGLYAQSGKNSIGLRFGLPTEVSYQKSLNSVNRIELGAGFRSYFVQRSYEYTTLSVSGVYQWNNDLSIIANGLNWYYGVGAGIGFNSYMNHSYIPISVLGQVGIQYDLNIPLRFSLDWRPEIKFGGYDYNGFVGDGICLGVRYIL